MVLYARRCSQSVNASRININSAVLPLGKFSQQASEAKNKEYK
jgi:hypothetical protein